MLALFLAALVLLPCALNAALYLALSRVRPRVVCEDDEEEPLPWPVLVAAFAAECAAVSLTALLSLAAVLGPRRIGDPAAGTRIVLLHGFGHNRGALRLLGNRLAALGLQTVFFSAPSWRVDIAADAEALRRFLGGLQEERVGPVHLIGFGVGGLIARYCVRRHRTAGVRRLTTLGTPHQGTLLGRFHLLGTSQIGPESPLMTQLTAADRSPEQFEATAIQSEFDAVVLPPENGYYPAAFNVVLRQTGHFSLLYSRRVIALIAENL